MRLYDGPITEIDNIETVYSDSAEVKIILKADKQIELQSGDREFPKGLLVEFYEDGHVKTTLTSNFGRHYKSSNRYMVSGNVVITDSVEGKKMNTEELFWLPDEDRVYVEKDKQVIVTTKDGVLHGKGLEANQNFSSYKILNPTSDGITIK